MTDVDAAAMGISRLPSDLRTALTCLQRDEILRAAIGDVISRHYVAVKEFEVQSYDAAVGERTDSAEVSDWERETYLELV
jgi:glutamine synthetase